MSEALNRLAELAGIAPSFSDYFGTETRVSDATKSALLAAMDYDVSSDDAIAGSLQRAEDETWTRVLPPVTMGSAETSLQIPCSLPAGPDGDALLWEIALEDRRSLRGDIAWNDAERVEERRVGGRLFQRRRVSIDARLPLGYHRLVVRAGDVAASSALIVVPDACYVPAEMQHGRIWTLATQLYALRSKRDWGIGDFSSLAALAILAGEAGAGAIGLNPLHELHPSNPTASSPYAPSSRLFLNSLYVDVTEVPDLAESPEARARIEHPAFQAALQSLRAQKLVDHRGVSEAKRGVFEPLFAAFCVNHLERPGDARAASFRAFVSAGGRELERLAVYEALTEFFRAGDAQSYGWLQWPAAYRSPDTIAVARFARERRERVDYYLYLQWLADGQLARAAAAGRECGVGLYRDLAVGVDLNGADAWSDQRTILAGVSLGAPADPLNARGQNWGLPPLSPRALRERSYAPLAALFRANMRHARVLRIDHIMALRRAFWIPRGRPAIEGAYVRYDLDEMLGILALESVRNGCIVVGEDLGTVPEGFRERLHAARALGSRLVYFERGWNDGAFLPPQRYPRLAAASIGTHDLPPLAGWWTGDDIALRAKLGLYPTGDAARAADEERRHARFMLIDALEREGCSDGPCTRRLREDAAAGGTLQVTDELSVAVHRFLGRTASLLAVVAIEDVLGEVCGVNVPGTVDEHPNWRRKRSLPLEALAADGRLFRIGAIMGDTQAMMLQEGPL
ncbi:MAG: 4-alpha-glucanotransferase [Candidatus Tumulicola sp.]